MSFWFSTDEKVQAKFSGLFFLIYRFSKMELLSNFKNYFIKFNN